MSVLGKLNNYKGNATMLVANHTVPDIIVAVHNATEKYFKRYAQVAHQFWAGSPLKTADKVYDWCRNNIEYAVEHDKVQTVKSPDAIVNEGYGDCKHYAQFIVGVLGNLHYMGYPIEMPFYRYAGYDKDIKCVHHVFAVLPIDGREIWIDPVLDKFNEKKQYFYFLDKKLPKMPIYEISGVGKTKKVNVIQRLKHGFDVNKANLQKGVKITSKKVKKAILKYNPLGATGRNAFLTLLKLNAFNMAHRLYDYMHRGGENEIRSKWASLGGNYNKLHTAITQGMRGYAARNHINLDAYNKQQHFIGSIFPMHKHHVFAGHYNRHMHRMPYYHPHFSDQNGHQNFATTTSGGGAMTNASYGHSVGMEPATMTALMTAAAGVIAAFAKIFQAAGMTQKDKSGINAAVDHGKKEIAKKVDEAENEQEIQDQWKELAKSGGHSTLKMKITKGADTSTAELTDGDDVDHADDEKTAVTKTETKKKTDAKDSASDNSDNAPDEISSPNKAGFDFNLSNTLNKIPTPIKWAGGAFVVYKILEETGAIRGMKKHFR